jgi:hypothetical protein
MVMKQKNARCQLGLTFLSDQNMKIKIALIMIIILIFFCEKAR